MIRNSGCDLCPLSANLQSKDICITFQGPVDAELLVVTKNPFSQKALGELTDMIREAGIEASLAFTSVTKCKVWDTDATRVQRRTCTESYLFQEIEAIKPEWVLALGNEALTALTGKAQVTKYRSQLFEKDGYTVFPTLSPSAVKRNPGQRGGFIADLQFLKNKMTGEETGHKIPKGAEHHIMDTAGIKALIRELQVAEGYAFDVETNGFNEYEKTSRMITLSVTTWRPGATGPEKIFVMPLYHPESPYKKTWRSALRRLDPYLRMPKRRVAHNGKFDLRWMNQFGAMIDLTFDTMLAAFLLDENRAKGLEPLARSLLGAPPWGIDVKSLLTTPLKDVMRYNGLDTWYTAKLYFLFRQQLKDNPRLYKLMGLMLVPASNVFTEIERRGIWTDREKLQTHAKIAKDTLDGIDAELMEYVPDQSEWPANVKEVNFNASNFARWWLFDHLEMPVLERGKDKEDGSPGAPSMAEGIMQKLQKHHHHPVIDLMLERVKWQKFHSSFFSSYLEQIDDNDRIHTTFKLTGTVTGRLSSGKGDDDKVVSRVDNRGVNLQQVPRDKFVKGVFGGAPGSVFLECDYSQVELRVAAFLAKEDTMIHLYQTEQDIHMATAMQMTGKPASQVTGDERKKAKPVNFGFLYGMSATTFITTAWNNYGVEVTEAESIVFRDAFFRQFPKLKEWHAKQKRMARKYKRVESPLGRVRNLPDVDSPVHSIKASAERQAINSPVQSFASDLAILALVTLTKEFKKRGLKTRSVGTVHDAINFEVPIEELEEVAPLIKHHMENVPLKKWFGVDMTVPIVGDVALSAESWGDKEEIDGKIITNPIAWRAWLVEKGYPLRTAA